MAFDPRQFKQKKKRAVDPNAPPRPNLMSHDKVIREGRVAFEELQRQVRVQEEEITKLKNNYLNMQSSINQIINVLRRIK